ncbi:MAG: exo-beta-N-acetylmuramidase NamZ domain-containing protein [Chitinophagales bacterium]
MTKLPSFQIKDLIAFVSCCICFQLYSQDIIPGAYQTQNYLPKLSGKRVGVVCNHSSIVGESHLIDLLIEKKQKVNMIFAPEHGFRGTADAGAHIKSGLDPKTGIPIRSLYGSNKKPKKDDLKDIDIVVFDIQDVGTRFYTYISTLQYVMEACADFQIPVIVLDRPNPNGHYVDGPVLDRRFSSFVGMQPIPIVYGMTIGEYAKMLEGEKWLQTKGKIKLTVVTCQNYSHKSVVKFSVPPSPNLKSSQAIALYPSLCWFEGTDVSVGRGTDKPFELYGSPMIMNSNTYSFIPKSMPGATSPLFMDKICYGEDLSKITPEPKVELKWLIRAHQNWNDKKAAFFLKNLFFDKLAGSDQLRKQIIAKVSENTIRKSWTKDINAFKSIRKKYLLYKDFEDSFVR